MKQKLALIDADTMIYQAAALIQKNPVTTKHKVNRKNVKTWDNITEFRTWLKQDENQGYLEEHFEISKEAILTEPLEHAYHVLKLQVEKVASKEWCKGIHLYVGGNGNYRKDYATITPYKGNRGEKPLAFYDVLAFFMEEYKGYITMCHGEEAEDGVAYEAWPRYLKARTKRNKELMDVVICHVDKDLNQIPGWHYNYSKDEDVFWLSDLEAGVHFWWQMLKGDPTDCIPGLQGVGQNTRNKYGLRASKGCGETSATTILDGVSSEKEAAQRVVDAYRDYYGSGWESPFRENGILLRMRSKKGEIWDAKTYCHTLGVNV